MSIAQKMGVTLKGAKETLSNYNSALRLKNKRSNMIMGVAISKAKGKYKEATGKEMTPSRLKDEYNSMHPDKGIREYEKNRDKEYKNLQTKMRSKGVY